MELILVLLAPFPLGLLLRHATAPYIAYTAMHSFVFTVQTLVLVMEWTSGSSTAFGRFPDGSPWSYCLVNLVIYLIGLALIALGRRTRARRAARSAVRYQRRQTSTASATSTVSPP